MALRFQVLATIAVIFLLCPSFVLARGGRPEVSCQLRVNEKYDLYDINGKTADQLRKEMRQRGTKWNDGATYAAETSWDIRYDYDIFHEEGRCSIKSVKTDVDIVYHLPHMVSSAPDSELTVLWGEFFGHLKRHEFGHKDIAVKAAAEINEILTSLGNFSNESELEREATRRTEEKFCSMKQIQIEYDHKTKHGETQGAVLRDQCTVLP